MDEHEEGAEEGSTDEEFAKVAGPLVYEFAYCSYQQGHFSQAEDAFRFLALSHPTSGSYWLGVGASMLMQSKHKEAIQPLELAASLNEHDPRPLIYVAECARELGDLTAMHYNLQRASARAEILRQQGELPQEVANQLDLALLLAYGDDDASQNMQSAT